MTAPTDGYGIYEGVITLANSAIYQPRLDQIAAAGFSLVLNTNLISGHNTDMIAYINYAATKGLKVIVPLHDPRIWRDGTYSIYSQMYADAGSPGTGTAFMQYIVAQTKALAGVWGWYVADEPVAGDHATFAPYSAAVKTADATHPRLLIEAAQPTAGNFYLGNTLYAADCDVGGDDYYPLGDNSAWAALPTVAAAIQTTCNSNSLGSAMVLQAFSWQQYGPSTRCSPWPGCAPWPSSSQMLKSRNDAINNMTPRLIMWYHYADVTSVNAPPDQWARLSSVITATQGARFSMVNL